VTWWNGDVAVKRCMTTKHLPPSTVAAEPVASVAREEVPLTVRDAATYLGVSIQTVYLWVERRHIPHLRVMGRNIRFLKSDLERFRAAFRQEAEPARS
jgi:excisionase family DNA binding protein